MAFVADSNRPQPLWQPPPTAYFTASGAASEAPSLLVHPRGPLPRWTPPPPFLSCQSKALLAASWDPI